MAQNPYTDLMEADHGPAAENPYTALIRQEQTEAAVPLRQSIAAAADTTPDQRAEALRLSKRFNVPPDVVGRSLPLFQEKAKRERTDYDRMLTESPALVEWLKESPDHAAVAADDLEALGALEWLVTAPQRAFTQGAEQVAVSRLRTKQVLGQTLTQAEEDQLAASKRAMTHGGALGAGDTWFRNSVTGGARLLPNLGYAAVRAAKPAAIGLVTGAGIGGAAGALGAGVGAVPGAVAGGLFGARTGAALGAAQFGFELEAGLAYDEFIDYVDPVTQERIDPAAARGAAIAAGTLNAGLEVFGLATLAKSIPGLDKLTGTLSRSAIRAALRQPTVRAALSDMVLSYGSTVGIESLTEVAQRAVTILAGELGKAATAKPLTFKTPAEIRTELGQEFAGALQGFALLSLPGPTLRAARDAHKATQGARTAAFVTALGEGVTTSATVARAPEAVQALLTRALEANGGPIKDLYVDEPVWTKFWQDQGVDPAEMTAQVTGDAHVYTEAQALGSLKIATAAYAVKLAATQHNGFFAQEIRLGDPNESNTREALAYQAEQQAIEQARLDQQAEAAEAAKPLLTSREAMRELVKNQVTEAGGTAQEAETWGTLIENVAATMVESAGFDPLAQLQKYGLKITRPDLGIGEAPAAALPQEAPVVPPATPAVQAAPTVDADLSPEERTAMTRRASDAAGASSEDLATPTKPGKGAVGVDEIARRELEHMAADEMDARALRPAGPVDTGIAADPAAQAPTSFGQGIVGEFNQQFGDKVKGEPNAAGHYAVFHAWWPGEESVDVRSFPVYNIVGGPRNGSTVAIEDLEAEGIPIPPTPPKPATYFQTQLALPGSPQATFYSRLERAVDEMKQARASGAQWKAAIKNAKIGVNKDEFAITGIDDLVDTQTYPKEEVLAYIRAHKPNMVVVSLGGPLLPNRRDPDADADEDEDEEEAEVTEDDLDDDAIQERTDELVDEAAQQAENDLDMDDIIGTATTIEDNDYEVEEEEEVDTGEVDEAGEPIMETEMVTRTETRYYPAVEGGYRERRPGRDGRRRYGVEERTETEVLDDDDAPYETEREAQRAAEQLVNDLDREPFYEMMSEQARENVDYDEARREAIEQLLRDANRGINQRSGRDARPSTRTRYSGYVIKPEAEAGSYRDIFLTAGDMPGAPVNQNPAIQVILMERVQGGYGGTVRQTWHAVIDGVPWHDQWSHPVVFSTTTPGDQGPAHDADFATKMVRDAWLQRPAERAYSWRDGHGEYDDIENPIVRLRLDIRPTLGAPLPPVELDQAIMQAGIDAGRENEAIEAARAARTQAAGDYYQAYTDAELARLSELAEIEEAARAEMRRAPRQTEHAPGPRVLFIEEIQPPKGSRWFDVTPPAPSQDMIQAGVDAKARLAEIPTGDPAFFETIQVLRQIVEAAEDRRITKKFTNFAAATKFAKESGGTVTRRYSGQQEKMPEVFLANWRTIAMKWALRHAVDLGLDGIAWTTGEQQVAHYSSIESKVEKVVWAAPMLAQDVGATPEQPLYVPEIDGVPVASTVLVHLKDSYRGAVTMQLDAQGIVLASTDKEEEIKGQPFSAVLGSEIEAAILAAPHGELTGKGLRFGGKGLKRLYNIDFPALVNGLPAIKAHGGKVGTVPMLAEREYEVVEAPRTEEQEVTGEDDPMAMEAARWLEVRHGNVEETITDINASSLNPQAKVALIRRVAGIKPAPPIQVIRKDTDEVVFEAANAPEARQWVSDHWVVPNPQPALLFTPALKAALLGGQAFLQEQPKARRGFLSIGPDRQMTIGLLKGANPSTFFHETGHFFLELFGDLVDQIGALDEAALTPEQQRMIRDYDGLLKWTGYETRQQQQAMVAETAAIMRTLTEEGRVATPEEAARLAVLQAPHEKFARGWEGYLWEGKAPSIELRSLFGRMRAWLLGVYASLKELHVELTPEVRGIMDRMVASEAAIAAAEAETSVVGLFTTAASAGMLPAEFELYREDLARVSQTAREELDRKALADVTKEQRAERRRRKKAITAEVTAEVHAQPVYRALAGIKRGTHPDGRSLVEGEVPEPLHLSTPIIAERFGADRARTLPAFTHRLVGGHDPAVVADLFGFAGAEDLLTAITAAAPMRQAIEEQVDARLAAEQASGRADATRPDAAKAALANSDRDYVIRKELRALGQLRRTAAPFMAQGKAAVAAEQKERDYERRWFEAEAKLRIAIAEGRKQSEINSLSTEVQGLKAKARGGAAAMRAAVPSDRIVREAARQQIAGTVIKNLTPARYWAAAMRYGRLATEAAARQDFDDAITAKQQELFNLALYREASRVMDDVDARVKRARDLGTPRMQAQLGLAGEHYADQVAGVLDRYSFQKATAKQLARRASVAKWVAALEGEGRPIDLPDEILNDARRIPYQEITVEELVGVTDGLAQIVHLARFKNRLLKGRDARDLATKAAGLVASIKAHAKGLAPEGERDRRPAEEGRRLRRSFLVQSRKVASKLREMDGLQDGGPMVSAIIFPLNAASDAEAEMNADATARLGALVEAAWPGREKRDLYEKRTIAGVPRALSKMERVLVALNVGNEGNRDRIRRGEGFTDVQIDAITNSLTKADWAFVSGIWRMFESYRPAMAAKHKRVYGVEPTWVEPIPVRTPFGTIDGGYFPIKPDDRKSAAAIAKADLDTANLARHAAYNQAQTRKGHLQARAVTDKKPLRRDFGVITEHLKQVIHDLAYHEALIDVGRVLGHRDVQQAILDHYGDIVYKDLRATIVDVALGDVPAANAWEQILHHARVGTTIAFLGWNPTTALLQPLGYLQSAVRLGPRYAAQGLMDWLGTPQHMVDTIADIHAESTFMRLRHLRINREIGEIRNSLGVSTGRLGGWVDDALKATTFSIVDKQIIADSFFFLITRMQITVDVPTYLGAKAKAMADPLNVTADGTVDEARAIAIAEEAVRETQATGETLHLATVQRGGPALKLWTNFFSFFSATYQMMVEQGKMTKLTNPLSVGRLAVDYVLLVTAPAVLGYIVRDLMRPSDPDDEDNAESWAWILTRESASYLSGTMLGVREVGGALSGFFGYEGPAGARAFASASAAVRQGAQVAQEVAETRALPVDSLDPAFWRAVWDNAGIWFHFPARQVARTLGGFTALVEGRTANPIALIQGPPPDN